MTFLPIVDRELRVTARRRSTHRVRLSVALTAMFLAGIILLVRGQLLALRRQFLGPMLLVAAIQLIFIMGQLSASPRDPRTVPTSMAAVLLLVADALALTSRSRIKRSVQSAVAIQARHPLIKKGADLGESPND